MIRLHWTSSSGGSIPLAGSHMSDKAAASTATGQARCLVPIRLSPVMHALPRPECTAPGLPCRPVHIARTPRVSRDSALSSTSTFPLSVSATVSS